MRGARAFVAVGLSAFVLVAAAGAALEVRLSVEPRSPRALERARVELRSYVPLLRADGSCCRLEPHASASYPLRLEAVSPRGKISRLRLTRGRANRWYADMRFREPGRWQVRVANFGPWYSTAAGGRPRIWVRVRPAAPTPAPAGFGPLGAPGCSPPSPRNAGAAGLLANEVFGTALGGEQLWSLFFLRTGSFASPKAAILEGVVGSEVKIVFRLTAPTRLWAVSPSGVRVEPVWGPTYHSGSSWDRPGAEWGAGFVFSEPGCWRLRAGAVGDVWLLVRS